MGKNVLITDWIQMLLNKYNLCLFDEFLMEDVSDCRWRFTPIALQYHFNDQWYDADAMLCAIARDESRAIKKIRFKPAKGDVYFYVEWIGEGREPYVTQTDWDGAAIDMYNFLHGNCFRTAEAAQEKTKEIYETIQKEVDVL